MWKCSPFYFIKFLDVDIVSKGPYEDLKVFQKAKKIIIMIVFKL